MDFASLMMAEFPAMQQYNYASINTMNNLNNQMNNLNNHIVPFNQISGQDGAPINPMGVQDRSCDMMTGQMRQYHAATKIPDMHLNHNLDADKPYQCQTCLKRFARQGQLTRHAQTHIVGQNRHLNTINTLDRPFQCQTCFKRFSSQDQLTKHSQIHFISQEKQVHTSNIDERIFDRTVSPARHKDVSSDQVNKLRKQSPVREVNPFLEMALATAREMKEKQNQKDRPYECPTCLKRFLTKTHLRRHLNTKAHLSGQCKPIIVNSTEGQSTQLIGINGPINGPPGKEKPFQCHLCSKRFTTQNHLKRHSEVHFGVKRFSCEVCHKTFLRSENLNIHKRMHSGERPYECHICFRRFSQPSSLKNHRKTHSDFKEFQCAICMKAFKAKCSLKRHLKLMHKDYQG